MGTIRKRIILDGLIETPDHPCEYRDEIWTILLRKRPTKAAARYINLIHKGPSPVYAKIKNDTFRTLASDMEFKQRVPEEALIRVLNAYAWHTMAENSENPGYVQGMNVLAALFLYVCKSESESLWLFRTFIQKRCPTYIRSNLDGVHIGVKLLDLCLENIDKPLYKHLRKRGLTAKIYGFASLMTFSACTPPLTEALALWDFYFAQGFHMNILCIVAQLVMIRDQLIKSATPNKLLRTLPPLQSRTLIGLTISFVPRLPDDLFKLLVRHTNDDSIQKYLS
ncbi:hypothetical protein CANCADRAFT_29071 [Tortispora caseinolytica NRRL Y-17796]|uniref:Rab-GAP TBC domain-containing protein n=1 Tax=Tortispora caseinolytica NRRL Y-17796 TaxID=767744 RepID=A0A1E4TBD2_9ASCO|nr:hypothetical protein CANCADRAFT_29071 [Tortispora caseinolytica NRRL Y-17796]